MGAWSPVQTCSPTSRRSPASPAYTELFRANLKQPGLRIPITAQRALFDEAVALGREVVWLHTFGERFGEGRPAGPPRVAEDQPAIPIGGTLPDTLAAMPHELDYDAISRRLEIGAGFIANVLPEVWAYEVSGKNVLGQWWSYRRQDRSKPPMGDKRPPSKLSDIKPTIWPAEYTTELLALLRVLTRLVALEPRQADLLARIVDGPTIDSDTLSAAALSEASAEAPEEGGEEEDGGLRIVQSVAIDDMTPGDRADAIGRDDDVSLGLRAVREGEPHRFAAILELNEPAPQMKALAAERGAEDPLQVGPMQAAIGGPEAQAIGLTEANGMSGDPRAGGAVAINELGWLGRRRNHRIEHAEPLQFPRAVGRQGDRCADFRQFVRLFEDLEGYSALTQRQRQRKAANACPDDCDAEPGAIGHGLERNDITVRQDRTAEAGCQHWGRFGSPAARNFAAPMLGSRAMQRMRVLRLPPPQST